MRVAGPDTGPQIEQLAAGDHLVGVRLRPGSAAAVLGLPLSALRDCRVDIDDVIGDSGRRLSEQVAAASATADVAVVLERFIGRRLVTGRPDPAVAAVVRRLTGDRGRESVGGLARSLGFSERHLLRRSRAALGYGPSVLSRILRFQRFIAAVRAPARPDLAQLAADCGYADQAHLSHETRLLAGLTPAALRDGARMSDPDKTPMGTAEDA